jgi:tetratricopeptide (TPR) repeat protein
MKIIHSFLLRAVASITCALASLTYATAADQPNVKESGVSLTVALGAHDFAYLEAETARWLRDYDDGELSGDEFYNRLNQLSPGTSGAEWQTHLELWVKQYPGSYPASYLLGRFFSNTAWQLRGSGFANQTSQKQFADMRRAAQMAEAQLLSSTKLFAKPFPSYCALIEVAVQLGNNKQEEYFRSAEMVDPKAFAAKERFLEFLTPKWGGSVTRMDAFIEASKNSPMSPRDKARLGAVAFERMGDYEKAQEDYNAAIEFYRKSYFADPGAHMLYRLVFAAHTAKTASYIDRAITLYSEAISIDPRNVPSRNMRGYLLETEKHDLVKA